MRTQVLELVRPMIARLPSGAASPVQTPPQQPSQEKPPPASPSNILDREVAREPQPLSPAQTAEVGHMSKQSGNELAGILVPYVGLQNDTEGYGYPREAASIKSICSRHGCSQS